jgi:hypothetical protein
MIKMAKIILLLCLCMGAMPQLWGQGRCPEIPSNYSWQTIEDYRKDADLVKKTLRWLTLAPLQLDLVTRSEANLFVMRWLAGTPDLKIEIQTSELPFIQAHPELLESFIHGMALAYLNKDGEVSRLDAYVSGFQSVAQVASQSKAMTKSRPLKPLLKAAKRREIKQYAQKIVFSAA